MSFDNIASDCRPTAQLEDANSLHYGPNLASCISGKVQRTCDEAEASGLTIRSARSLAPGSGN